jgi:hypothetical protein
VLLILQQGAYGFQHKIWPISKAGKMSNFAREAAENLAREAAEQAAKKAAIETAEQAARNAAKETAERAATSASKQAAEEAAQNAAREAAERAINKGAKDLAEEAAEGSAKDAAQKAVQNQADLLTGAEKQAFDGLSAETKKKIFKGLAPGVALGGFITYWQMSGKSLDQALHDAPKDAGKAIGQGTANVLAPTLGELLPDVDWKQFIGPALLVVGFTLVGYAVVQYVGAKARAQAVSSTLPTAAATTPTAPPATAATGSQTTGLLAETFYK